MSEIPQEVLDWERQHKAGVVPREKRDALLLETDVWGLADYPATAEQLAYRQALRDLPMHSDWPAVADSDWPTKPE
jgi:hypothetical protein